MILVLGLGLVVVLVLVDFPFALLRGLERRRYNKRK
jgi:hypothetical protein